MLQSNKVIFANENFLQMKNKNQTAKEKREFATEAENNLFVSKSYVELIALFTKTFGIIFLC